MRYLFDTGKIFYPEKRLAPEETLSVLNAISSISSQTFQKAIPREQPKRLCLQECNTRLRQQSRLLPPPKQMLQLSGREHPSPAQLWFLRTEIQFQSLARQLSLRCPVENRKLR